MFINSKICQLCFCFASFLTTWPNLPSPLYPLHRISSIPLTSIFSINPYFTSNILSLFLTCLLISLLFLFTSAFLLHHVIICLPLLSSCGFNSFFKCCYLFLFFLHPILTSFHPSISPCLSQQVARTPRSGSVTRSAMTEGKRDSTTGTFPGLLLIRGAGHAL